MLAAGRQPYLESLTVPFEARGNTEKETVAFEIALPTVLQLTLSGKTKTNIL